MLGTSNIVKWFAITNNYTLHKQLKKSKILRKKIVKKITLKAMSLTTSVELSLEGLARTYGNLIFYKNHKIVTRRDNDRNNYCTGVKLISGGGSGHEPTHAGYVGYGMLTTVVCGNIFASPSVAAILNSILITGTPETPIILIVKNYTGDRLNFGLAAEIAKSKYNYENIRMIMVEDDVAIEDKNVKSSTGRRGLAGTVLIHKLIGAMAEHRKMEIDEICEKIENILTSRSLCTIGFSFQSKLGIGLYNVEIGKGIHGEPGVQTLDNIDDFKVIIDIMVEKFKRNISRKQKVMLLVNNLGGTSEFLMNIFLASLIPKLNDDFEIVKCITGLFLTSLNNEGISVTVLNINESTKEYLDCIEAPTCVPSNVFGTNQNNLKVSSIIHDSIPIIITENTISTNDFGVKMDGKLLEILLIAVCNAISENAENLNRIDLEFGDGDTGSTLKGAAETILASIKNNQFNFDYPQLILQTLSDIFQNNVGGTSGALYSIFFQASSTAFKNDENCGGNYLENLRKAFQWGNGAIMKYGLGKEGDRTMLDPLICCERILFETDDKMDKLNLFKLLSRKCMECAENTKNMIPKSGRAAYTFAEGMIISVNSFGL